AGGNRFQDRQPRDQRKVPGAAAERGGDHRGGKPGRRRHHPGERGCAVQQEDARLRAPGARSAALDHRGARYCVLPGEHGSLGEEPRRGRRISQGSGAGDGRRYDHVPPEEGRVGRLVMYEAFFGLRENPFGTTPDPRYLYKSRAHREALAYLAHGIFLKKGFLALTGEVGVGKTTVVRAFVQTFHPCLEVSFVINTRVDFREMLFMLLTDFGVEIKSESKVVMLSQLNEFLIKRYAENQNPVLVIDEAQNLSPDVLEE